MFTVMLGIVQNITLDNDKCHSFGGTKAAPILFSELGFVWLHVSSWVRAYIHPSAVVHLMYAPTVPLYVVVNGTIVAEPYLCYERTVHVSEFNKRK